MQLVTPQLKAFEAIAQTGNFSKAAEKLHITQPALSRRIQNLESDLGITLALRTSSGVHLTPEGFRLLKYIKTSNLIEEELLFDFSKKSDGSLGGMLRIAGYGSLIHPAVVPAMAEFLREHPNIQVTFIVKDVSEVPSLLFSGEADFILTNDPIDRSDLIHQRLGFEEYVAIESSQYNTRKDIYLDTSPADLTTVQFFKIQSKKLPKYRRSFLHDESGILLGVELGLGRAIKSKHMIKNTSAVRILKNYRSLKKPIYLQYWTQPYYTQLQKAVIQNLITAIPQFL